MKAKSYPKLFASSMASITSNTALFRKVLSSFYVPLISLSLSALLQIHLWNILTPQTRDSPECKLMMSLYNISLLHARYEMSLTVSHLLESAS
jgi:hypothetical protein